VSVREELHAASPLGRHLAQYQIAASTARAVRLRRDLLARIIDDVAMTQASPDILSIACGHLREAKLAEAVQARRIGRFVALDHDPASLNVVATDLAPFGVEPVVGSVRTLLRGKPALGTFDLVYAAGLFDYLSLKVAQRLLAVMFGLLKPQGRLVVTNAVPDLPEIGFMESFMDWALIYRTVPELAAMAAALPIPELADLRIYGEDQHAFLFLDIRRR
jgi:SAM-dependent methyltransferase